MSSSPETLLETLSVELSNEEFESARATVADLEEEYENRRGEEVERLQQSQALYLDVNQEGVSLEEASELNEISGLGGGTQFLRAVLLTVATTLVEAHEELATEGRLAEVTDVAQAAIDELSESENRLEEQTPSTQEILDKSTIPPSVNITIDSIEQSPLTPSEETTLTTTVMNTGDTQAEGVSVEISSTDGLDVSPRETPVGSLKGGNSVGLNFEISALEPGGQSIEIEATSDNAGSDVATRVVTVTPPEATSVEDYTNEEGVVDTDGLRAAVGDWQAGDIDTDLLREVVTAWQSGEPVG
ncbi:hypothetical protein [Halobacteriaceae bacterium SHR40]|uniref:hypothetical protein n=1 Tax=Halovenus amylolytica TaxID=2500550 RepID=UPI000FE36C2F